MFDLRSAQSAWRREMESCETVDVEALAELESHLLDEFDALCASGLEGKEAFDLAVRRLGSCASLQAEFAKRGPRGLARERALWAVLGVMAWMTVSAVWVLISSGVTLLLCAVMPEALRGESWLFGDGSGFLSEGYALTLALAGSTILYLLLRRLESPGLDRWLFRLRRITAYPLRVAALVVSAIAILHGVRWGVNLALARVYEPEVFGRAAALSASTKWALSLCQPLILGAALLRWRSAIEAREPRGFAKPNPAPHVPAPVFWMLLGAVGYSLLGPLLAVLQHFLNLSWLSLRPDAWTPGSWLFGEHYPVSELEIALLVLLPLAALILLVRRQPDAWFRGCLDRLLRLMHQPSRFWPAYLFLCWIPELCLVAIPASISRLMDSETYGSVSMMNAVTHGFLAFALLVGVIAAYLLVARRGPPEAGAQVERSS